MGAGIGWHKDKQEFGIIVGVSLLTSATMRFRRANWRGVDTGISYRKASVDLHPRWRGPGGMGHSIPPLSDLRYSITFRTLSKALRV